MSTIDASKMDVFIDGKKVKDGKQDETPQQLNFQWWSADEEDAPGQVANTVQFLAKHQAARMEQLTVSTRLYGNSQAFSLIGTAFTRASSVMSNPNSSRISFNLCASVIDTLTAKIAKNRINPQFCTNGGDWDIQLKAEQLSKFVEGCFYQTGYHQKSTDRFRHAAAWGTGITHIYRERDKICAEAAFPHEFFVDLVETLAGPPTQLHRVRIAERNVLLALYPDKDDQEKILLAKPANFDQLGATGTAADLVTLTDSYHLPSNPDADEQDTDGLHMITVGDQCILRDPWTKNYFPFVFEHYSRRLLGFWGQGACERLQNLQGEINRLMILVQRSMWMNGSFKVLVENGSKVVSQHLNNDVGAIIHYTGTPPQYVTPPMIQQDIYPYIDALINKGFRQEGVSELEASSVKPIGVNSGKAMRTMANIADDRQLFIQQNHEACDLEAARQMIECAKDIYREKKSYKVLFPTTSFVQEIDWKDIRLDEDQYVMKAFPMSSLADDLAGRLSDIQEYMQAGLISPRAGRRLMRKPDLEMADKLADAQEDLLHRIFEDILSEKGYKAPEPYFDLTLARSMALEYYNYADYHNCPDERLQLLRKWMQALDDLTGVNAPAVPPVGSPPPQAMAPGAPPQAVPAAPPVSQLLPNAPMKAAA